MLRHQLILSLAVLPFLAATPAAADWRAPSPAAIKLAQDTIIIDGHVDIPYRLRAHPEDIGVATPRGDFDYPRAKAGGLNAPFMSIYTSAEMQAAGTSRAEADALIDLVEGIVAAHPDKFAIARTVADVRRITRKGLIALPLGMENGAPIGEDLALLDHFYGRGIRYITLTHSRDNAISDSSYDTAGTHGGLSPFGVKVVERMNDLGIMVDVSHISDAAFDDVMATTRVPVIASHSSARHFTPGWERNMSDDMIRRLGENGGVIMINYGSRFLTQTYADWSTSYNAAFGAWRTKSGAGDDDATEAAFEGGYVVGLPKPFATVDDVLNHIDHAVKLAGIDHVALGSDFDGVGDSLPEGLKDASMMPNLVQGLMDRGYSRKDIQKILSGNAFRVWSAVEKGARRPR